MLANSQNTGDPGTHSITDERLQSLEADINQGKEALSSLNEALTDHVVNSFPEETLPEVFQDLAQENSEYTDGYIDVDTNHSGVLNFNGINLNPEQAQQIAQHNQAIIQNQISNLTNALASGDELDAVQAGLELLLSFDNRSEASGGNGGQGFIGGVGEDHLVDTHAVLSDVGQLLQALDGGGLGDQVSSALDLLGSIDRFDDDVEGLSDFVNSEGAQNLVNGLDVLDAINNNEWGAVLGDSAQLLSSLGGNFSGDRLSAIGNFADFYDSINGDNWASALQSGAGLYNQFNPDGQIGNGQLGSALSTLSLYESIEAGNWSGALHSGTNLYNSINDSNVGGAGSP